jgi:hypothetical protein
MDKIIENLFNKSMICIVKTDDNWLYTLKSEYLDDDEGQTKNEFFRSNWIKWFPLKNELEFLSEQEIIDLENLIIKSF